jgi:hypothetical protein
MFIHIFAFQWKPETTDEQKARVVPAIRALQDQIPGIIETHVGLNESPRSSTYQLGGVMKFADEAAMDAYATHPVHLALLAWLMPLIDPIEVDFAV